MKITVCSMCSKLPSSDFSKQACTAVSQACIL